MKKGDKTWEALMDLIDVLGEEPMLKTMYRERMAFIKVKAKDQGYLTDDDKNKVTEALVQLFARSKSK